MSKERKHTEKCQCLTLPHIQMFDLPLLQKKQTRFLMRQYSIEIIHDILFFVLIALQCDLL